MRVKTFDHELGECGLLFFASPGQAAELAPGFPESLDGAPAMLPTPSTAMRHSLEQWFASIDVHPRVVAEFDDAALLMVFAADELGFFAVPEVIGDEIGHRYGAELIGTVESCRERFFAISVQRKLKHPAVAAITDAARRRLFA
jgi:LysR family transcriptional activator of nhaA